jgi:purine-binding chemotaxis protein CheW
MTDDARILRERARALAAPRADANTQAESAALELLEFRLADERYAVATAFVHGIHPLRSIAPVPCTPPFVHGIVSVRGLVFTVIGLKKFFGLPEQGLTDLHRIVLVGATAAEFGLLADVSVGLVRLHEADLLPPPPNLTAIGARYIRGVAADGLVVLDMPAILADPALLVNETPDGANRPQEENPA